MGALLDLILLFATVRAFCRLLSGVVSGIRSPEPKAPSRAPEHGVQMVRDPVCGTFVVPERAVSLTAGGHRLHFCSAGCRDQYRIRTASDRPGYAEGRTA